VACARGSETAVAEDGGRAGVVSSPIFLQIAEHLVQTDDGVTDMRAFEWRHAQAACRTRLVGPIAPGLSWRSGACGRHGQHSRDAADPSADGRFERHRSGVLGRQSDVGSWSSARTPRNPRAAGRERSHGRRHIGQRRSAEGARTRGILCRRDRHNVDMAIERSALRTFSADLARYAAGGGFPSAARAVALWSKRRHGGNTGEPSLSVDQQTTLGFRLAGDQMHIERHQCIRQGER